MQEVAAIVFVLVFIPMFWFTAIVVGQIRDELHTIRKELELVSHSGEATVQAVEAVTAELERTGRLMRQQPPESQDYLQSGLWSGSEAWPRQERIILG